MVKYLNFLDIFSKKFTKKLFKQSNINKYTINLQPDKQLFYKLIYNLELIELKTFKIYIKTNLANSCIYLFKSLTKSLIFFIQIFNSSFYLYIDYQSFNNLTIKNQYTFLLIGKLFD